MSLWNQVIDKIKEMFNKMIGRQPIQEVLHITPNISGNMINAIELWTRMYEGRAPWLKNPTEDDPSAILSLGLPQLIASEKARTALIEFESEITTPMKEVKPATPNYMNPANIGTDGKPEPVVATHVVTQDIPKGSTKRAEYLNKQYEKLKGALRIQLEYGIAKGGLVIKPYPVFDDDFKSSKSNAEFVDSSKEKSTSDKTIESSSENIKLSTNTLKSNDSSEKEKKDY